VAVDDTEAVDGCARVRELLRERVRP